MESRPDGVHWIHWTRIDSDGKVYFLFVRDLEKSHPCWMRGGKSSRWSPSDPLDTNRFRWKSSFSIRERLRKIPACWMRGGKSSRWSPSDPLDTNRFRWKSLFSIRERLRKIPPMLHEGWKVVPMESIGSIGHE